jgi:hypothetical protein
MSIFDLYVWRWKYGPMFCACHIILLLWLFVQSITKISGYGLAYNRLCKSLTSTCDLDLEGRDICVTHDISAYHCDFLCLVISKSWRSSRSDTKYTLTQIMFTLTSKRDLELGGRDAGVTQDTLSYYSDYLWQVFTKSFDLWKSYRLDTKYAL